MFTFVFFALWIQNRTHVQGLGFWTLNLFFHTAGRFIATMNPNPLSPGIVVLGNIFTLVGAVFFLFGLAAFTSMPLNRRNYVIFSGVITFLMIITVFVNNQLYRSLLNGATTLFLSLQYIRILWIRRNINPLFTKPLRFLLGIYILFSISFLYRIIGDLAALAKGFSMAEFDSATLRMSNLIALIALTGVNFITLILSNNKLLSEIALESSEKSIMLEKLKLEVEHDGLTGVLNRSGLEHILDSIFSRQKEEDRYMLILLDIDNFKDINDSYGHEMGDRVLIQLANLLTGHIRSHDYVGRWGGDEFLIIADSSSISEFSLPDRLLNGIQSFDWKSHFAIGDTPVTLSLGFTKCHIGESKMVALKRCDKNLYRAKKEGKNRAIGTEK